jgi:hypothetical protein
MTQVNRVLAYAYTLVGIPYRWHREEDQISGVDKFYASNDGIVYSREDIIGDEESNGKCIVCTGLINLMRKYAGLTIPGLDGSLGEVGISFPGTTGIWFMHLERKGVIHPLHINKTYPPGTLLLRDFHDVVYDQGHVAVVVDDDVVDIINTTHEDYGYVTNSPSVLNQYIIHSYSQISYNQSKIMNITNVGKVSVEKMHLSHFWEKKGYYTHVCYPEDWILTE